MLCPHSGDSDAATDLYLTFTLLVSALGNEQQKYRHCLPHIHMLCIYHCVGRLLLLLLKFLQPILVTSPATVSSTALDNSKSKGKGKERQRRRRQPRSQSSNIYVLPVCMYVCMYIHIFRLRVQETPRLTIHTHHMKYKNLIQ